MKAITTVKTDVMIRQTDMMFLRPQASEREPKTSRPNARESVVKDKDKLAIVGVT
ncbi:hypothetical protein J6TS1_30160 [Siminovitchia terrae]|uniref:Uncharacterized protein n=1 Tax=Siminovitchia terrae TaxID=1914933 RepID=A0ABQ4KYW4_SIMTE|nr:hypothetical protein J22TS1_35190 [Siminovitchia terrae]GIN97146.1 hypothetical protein J6TS1_30160 [Siminovitchia terrae]